MPKVAICTLFRDCIADVVKTFENRAKLGEEEFHHICMEGDSIDGTYEALQVVAKRVPNVIVEKIDSGAPKYGSVIEPERLKVLSQLWNRALDIAQELNVDYAIIMDSDITMPPGMFKQLIGHNKAVIAPMMFFEKSIFFRDTWAYRGLDGEQFTNRPRYHKSYRRPEPFQVESVGLPLMTAEVIKAGARTTAEAEVVGLCAQIRALGHEIFVDPLAITYHPRGDLLIPKPYEHK
jgi:glycosyltransferase involved in cell wall biosynthesis